MKNTVHTTNAPEPIGPYVQAVSYKDKLYISGQIGICPETMSFPHHDIKEQTAQVLNNMKAILIQEGASLDTLIKTTCFLTDMENFDAFNEVYEMFFHEISKPARSCIGVASLPKGALVEIEGIAYLM